MSRTAIQKNMEANNMPDWDTLLHGDMLQREDIYRQRIFGNNPGSFIELEERNKLPAPWLVLFLFFIAATWMYTFARLNIGEEYFVYEAIRRPLETTVFRSQPQSLVFEDIDNMQDVQDWLLNAFPDIMTPDVQHFNMPLGQIRFSMRKMKMEQNIDERFNDYHHLLWLNKDGISPNAKNADHDDPASFGVYRVWATVNLNWNHAFMADSRGIPNKRCPLDSTWIDMVDFSNFQDSADDALANNCRQWCEQLIRPLTCHCFELSEADGRCNFYQVRRNSFGSAADSALTALRAPEPSEMTPDMQEAPNQGLFASFPLMKQFEFQNSKLGYEGTPGFIQLLSYYTQEELLALAKLEEITPSPPQRVMSSEIEDWIAGGYIGRDTVTVSVDFVTYNPNYEMFSWVQILFESRASGYVQKSIKISSDKIIKSKELSDSWTLGNEFDSIWEIAYIGLVLFYVGCEIWRMSCCAMGVKYFASGWTWLTLTHLFFNLVTIALFLGYKGQTDFINELVAMQGDTDPTFKMENLISFSAQVSKYWTFKIAAAFNLLFLACQLLQYLHDIYPRVTVLVETVSDSFVPIFYFTLVCLVVFYGVFMWLHIWFGRKIEQFSSAKNSLVAVVSMTVGEFSSFRAVREVFGYATFGFYIPCLLFSIVIILNFPRAVLNAGYADASLKHQVIQKEQKKARAAKDSNAGADGLLRYWKEFKMKVRSIMPEELSVKNLTEQVQNRESVPIKHKRANLCCFIIFVILYTIVCTMIINTNSAYSMTKMVEHAIMVPTFSKFSPLTGQAIRGANFNSINSRKDVSKFLSEVLPTAMFFTSTGTFDGKDNMLLNYSSAPQFKQLVLSNWNIMVGQKPVRMTAKLSKMKPLGSNAVRGVVSPNLWVREAADPHAQSLVSEVDGMPDGQFMSETLLSGVNDTKTRNLLAKYCNYSFGYGAASYDDLNGFVCMLDVNQSSTIAELSDMATGGFINSQMEALSIEFLLYNAWAQTFAYVAIRFAFQPSGIIWKDVEVEPVSLELLTGFQGGVLIILMSIMMIMNFYYFFANLWEILKAIAAGYREAAAKPDAGWSNKVATMLREYVYFYLLDWFNLLDYVSCISTLVVMIMFFQFTSSSLSSYYYFQEEPTWVEAKCTSRNFEWCSDQQVLTQFATAKDQFRIFTRVSALNTVLIYMRTLRYLKEFKHMKVIFSTLIRGFEDIVWFVIIFFTGQLGYMLMGHIIFGASAWDFSTRANAMQACLDIFLGTFDSETMAEASLAIMIFYVLTYWFVFKLIFVNMFLAIIDKNYKELDDQRVEKDGEKEKQDIPVPKKPSMFSTLMAQVKGLFKKGSSDKSEDAVLAATPLDGPTSSPALAAAGDGGTGASAMSTPMVADTGRSSDPTIAEETSTTQDDVDRAKLGKLQDEVQETAPVFTKEQVKNPNWKLLPEDVKDWSLEKANEVNTFIHEMLHTRHLTEGDQNEAAVKDALETAETTIGEKRKIWAHEAQIEKSKLDSQELSELRKVHQDQESLSWYIMKRDAELKKLESAKELKKDRFEKMVKAANSLIKRDEDVQAGDQLSVANR